MKYNEMHKYAITKAEGGYIFWVNEQPYVYMNPEELFIRLADELGLCISWPLKLETKF